MAESGFTFRPKRAVIAAFGLMGSCVVFEHQQSFSHPTWLQSIRTALLLAVFSGVSMVAITALALWVNGAWPPSRKKK